MINKNLHFLTLFFFIITLLTPFLSFGQKQEIEGIQSFFKYDKNNRLIQKISIDHYDKSSDTTYYKYNANGQLITEIKNLITKSYHYNSNGKQNLITSYNSSSNKIDTLNIRTYDSKGRLKVEKELDFIRFWSVYEYTNNTKTRFFLNFQDSSVYSKRVNFYDKNKKIIKSYHYQKDSSLSDSTLYFYNDMDSLIRTISYPDQGSKKIEWKITSDQILKTTNYYGSTDGDLVQKEIKIFIYNNKKQLIEKRVVDYHYAFIETIDDQLKHLKKHVDSLHLTSFSMFTPFFKLKTTKKIAKKYDDIYNQIYSLSLYINRCIEQNTSDTIQLESCKNSNLLLTNLILFTSAQIGGINIYLEHFIYTDNTFEVYPYIFIKDIKYYLKTAALPQLELFYCNKHMEQYFIKESDVFEEKIDITYIPVENWNHIVSNLNKSYNTLKNLSNNDIKKDYQFYLYLKCVYVCKILFDDYLKNINTITDEQVKAYDRLYQITKDLYQIKNQLDSFTRFLFESEFITCESNAKFIKENN